MNMKGLRELPPGELRDRATTAGEALFRIRFQQSMGNVEGLKRLREHKLDIARVKTLQRERLGSEQALGAARETPSPSSRTAGKHQKRSKDG